MTLLLELPETGDFPPSVSSQTATISSGETISSVIDVGKSTRLGIIVPATCTGTNIEIHAGATADGPFYLTDESFSGAQGVYGFASTNSFTAFRFLVLVSDSSEAATRSFYISTK